MTVEPYSGIGREIDKQISLVASDRGAVFEDRDGDRHRSYLSQVTVVPYSGIGRMDPQKEQKSMSI